MSSPARADARRNRERLLSAAREAFTADGPATSLEGVARTAGVGIGTLYRHFPTREALVEAVFHAELAALGAQADELAGAADPVAALRAWIDHYGAFVATKRGMADALHAAISAGTKGTTHARVTTAVGRLLHAGAVAGALRDDVATEDVVASLHGIFLATTDPEQAGRMADLLVDGLRVR